MNKNISKRITSNWSFIILFFISQICYSGYFKFDKKIILFFLITCILVKIIEINRKFSILLIPLSYFIIYFLDYVSLSSDIFWICSHFFLFNLDTIKKLKVLSILISVILFSLNTLENSFYLYLVTAISLSLVSIFKNSTKGLVISLYSLYILLSFKEFLIFSFN